jgi:hypothetical protein
VKYKRGELSRLVLHNLVHDRNGSLKGSPL